jgi:hypothetical protein
MASVVFVMPWWLGRAKDRQDEEHLVRFLETTLEAKEQAVTDNTVTILDTSLPTFTPSSQRWTLRTALSVDECIDDCAKALRRIGTHSTVGGGRCVQSKRL